MNTTNLEELAEDLLLGAKINLKTCKSLLPIVMASKDESKAIYQFALPWKGDEEKYAMIDAVTIQLRDIKPDIVMFIAEAWQSSAGPKDDLAKHIPPSKDPGKKEIVMIMVLTKHRTVSLSCPFERDEEGKVVNFGEHSFTNEFQQHLFPGDIFGVKETVH